MLRILYLLRSISATDLRAVREGEVFQGKPHSGLRQAQKRNHNGPRNLALSGPWGSGYPRLWCLKGPDSGVSDASTSLVDPIPLTDEITAATIAGMLTRGLP